MRLMLAIAVLLAPGCVGSDDPSTPAGDSDRGTNGGAQAVAATESSTTPDAAESATDQSVPRALTLLHEGNVGTGFIVCAAGRCEGAGIVESDKEVILEQEAGRIVGGELTLTWTAATPATERLTLGFMTMSGDGCDPVDLGTLQGPSPLVLVVPDAGRDLCAGEVIHAWVAATTFGDVGPSYHQAEVDQAFRLEGEISLAPPLLAS